MRLILSLLNDVLTVHRVHHPDTETATALLPFALLLANTRRPEGVLLRVKNPCFRILFFLFIFIAKVYRKPHDKTMCVFFIF